ncbi:MAG: hypothetical protein M3Q81_04435, partial [bacterium]|nr:hypothetical protein [bacterium]
MSSSGTNLTQVTYIGRQTVKFGTIALVAMIVGRTVFSAAVAYWKAANPPPPPPPTVGFGILPMLDFSAVENTTRPQSYSLETANGGLPTFGDRAKVFFMPKATISLLADEAAKRIAAEYNFVFSPTALDSQTYRWNKSQPLETSLEMKLNTFNFELSSNYLSRSDLLGRGSLPSDFQSVTTVKSFLSAAGLLPDDMATASGEVVYLKALGGELQPAVSFSDADFIQVDLNRVPIDSLWRMYTEEGYVGIAHAVVTGAFSGNDSLVEMNFKYHPIDYTQLHTYPLRST